MSKETYFFFGAARESRRHLQSTIGLTILQLLYLQHGESAFKSMMQKVLQLGDWHGFKSTNDRTFTDSEFDIRGIK